MGELVEEFEGELFDVAALNVEGLGAVGVAVDGDELVPRVVEAHAGVAARRQVSGHAGWTSAVWSRCSQSPARPCRAPTDLGPRAAVRRLRLATFAATDSALDAARRE